MPSIHPLIELAQDPAADTRLAMLRSVTDLFFAGDAGRTRSETLLFEDIATRVLDEADVPFRSEFAARLADQISAPRLLLMRLAGDEISVAQPVLERSAALSDRDLAAIALDMGDPHLCAICRRNTLAAIVTDVLVRRGSELVLRLVADNAGACFSAGGFDRLIRRSAGDEELQQALALRRDVPAGALSALAGALAERLRIKLLARGYDDPDSLPPGLASRLRDSLGIAVHERTRDLQALDRIIQEIRGGTASLRRVVVTLARGDRAYDLAVMAAALADVEQAVVIETLTGAAEEPLIVLFKAIGVPWEGFEAVLQMRARQSRQPYGHNPTLAHTYAEMERSTAQRVLAFLKTRRDAMASLAPDEDKFSVASFH